MTTASPYVRHYNTAREHLAGMKASQAWIQELTAAHLLHVQDPIRDQPITDKEEAPS